MIIAVVLLAIGLAPGMALAQEGGLNAASAPLATQTVGGTYGTLEVVDGPTFAGPKCSITFKADASIFLGTSYNSIVFRVFKGGTQVAEGTMSYTRAQWDTQEWTFNATSTGTYSVTAYLVVDVESAVIATDTFKVVELTSVIKSVTPEVNADCKKVGKVTLTWNNKVFGKKVTGAKVYRATKKSGKYKLIKTTTKAKYVDKVKKNKNFFYKVKLYVKSGKKTYVSKFSKVKELYLSKPATPKIKSAKKTANGVTITWKASANCVYQLLRSTKKNTGYETIAGVWKRDDGMYETNGSVLDDGTYIAGSVAKIPTYVDTAAKPGTTYYYKVRAFRQVSAEITADSAAKKVKA